MNNILAIGNLLVLLFIVFGGFYLGKLSNWNEPGGFLPFGFSSLLDGAAQAYFAFVGYEAISILSEEAATPEFSVPFAMFFCIGFVIILYCSVCAALTTMVPYTKIVEDVVFPAAFGVHGWNWAQYFVNAGALAALVTSLLSRVSSMSRFVSARKSISFRFFCC